MLLPRPRTAEQKADRLWSWRRPDAEFFSSGACHILAQVFVERFRDQGFRPLLILPRPGFSGGHVVAANRDVVFDAGGFTARARFLGEYVRHFQSLHAGWRAALLDISGWLDAPERIERLGHRPPDKFLSDPIERARLFIDRLVARARFDERRAADAQVVAPRKTWF